MSSQTQPPLPPIGGQMLPSDRRTLILELVGANGSVRTTWLAERLGVTPITVRRDLRVCADQGKVRLVHGGAILAEQSRPISADRDLATKRVTNLQAKSEIARKAADLVKDGDVVAFNAGSTVELVVERLRTKHLSSLTVVSLCLNVGAAVESIPEFTLIMPGGTLRRPAEILVGANAIRSLAELRVDKAFFGALAVDVEAGWTHPDLEEVAISRQLLEVSTHSYLVADSTTFGRTAVGRICNLEDFDALVVDSQLPEGVRKWATATGTPLI